MEYLAVATILVVAVYLGWGALKHNCSNALKAKRLHGTDEVVLEIMRDAGEIEKEDLLGIMQDEKVCNSIQQLERMGLLRTDDETIYITEGGDEEYKRIESINKSGAEVFGGICAIAVALLTIWYCLK